MTYIIAEISGNHNGSLDGACDLIRIASLCGCDAVKFQLYKPEDMHDPANNGLYEKYQIPREWLDTMFETANRIRVPLFASVFAPWAVIELRRRGVKKFKIASPESTRLPIGQYQLIIEQIRMDERAQIIFSTGMADYESVEALEGWNDSILYCKAGYPATIDESDLEFISHNALGFSDHTVGFFSTMAAIGAGATIIEKHFKLTNDCIDAAFSLFPDQMKALCELAT